MAEGGKESVPWKIMPRKKPSYPWWWTRSNAALRRRWESENELFNPEAFHHDRVRTLQTTLHVLERTRECRWTWRGNSALIRVDGEMGKTMAWKTCAWSRDRVARKELTEDATTGTARIPAIPTVAWTQ